MEYGEIQQHVTQWTNIQRRRNHHYRRFVLTYAVYLLLILLDLLSQRTSNFQLDTETVYSASFSNHNCSRTNRKTVFHDTRRCNASRRREDQNLLLATSNQNEQNQLKMKFSLILDTKLVSFYFNLINRGIYYYLLLFNIILGYQNIIISTFLCVLITKKYVTDNKKYVTDNKKVRD